MGDEVQGSRAIELLERLVDEPDFYARVEANPREALAEYFEVPEGMPEKVDLPPPDTIAKALATLPQTPSFRIQPDADRIVAICFFWVDRLRFGQASGAEE